VAWDVVYYKSADGRIPAEEFLDECPVKVAANLLAVVDAVAEAPPPSFSGGGKWEAMHGDMTGYFEVRATGPGREQFRLFCLLEKADDAELARRGLERPAIAILSGLRKRPGTVLDPADYAKIRRLGDDHRSNFPRRIA